MVFYRMPRFWSGALLLGALMSTLYAVEFTRGLMLIFSHQRTTAKVVSRKVDGGFSEIGYEFEEKGQSIVRMRRYRFPETLFIRDLGEGESIELIHGGGEEMPVPLVRFEIFSSLGLFLAATLLFIRAVVEIRKARGQKQARKL